MNPNLILLIVAMATLIAMIALLLIQKFNHRPKPAMVYIKSANKFLDTESTYNSKNKMLEQCQNKSRVELLMDNLKLQPEKFSSDGFDYFKNIPLQDFNERWIFVYTISEYNQYELAPLLEKIANLDIQSVDESKTCYYQQLGDETTIRLRAIKGLENIAKMGGAGAENALLNLLKNNCFSINMAAVESLLEIDVENIKRVKEMLPKNKLMLLESAQSVRFGNYFGNQNMFSKIDFMNKPVLTLKYI